MRVNLNQLRCFYFAAKLGSVSKAAETLFVTPSAVSMQIKKLEKWLDVRLMIREGNTIKMTQEAKSIFAQTQAVFGEIDTLETQIQELKRSHKNEVTIGCHSIPAKYILPKLMDHIQRINPTLRVKMVLGSVGKLMLRLHENELDFVLTGLIPSCVKISTIPLFSDELLLVAKTGSRHVHKTSLSIQELATLPLLLQREEMPLVDRFLNEANIIPKSAMDGVSADVIKPLLKKDMGGALLLRFTVQEELDSGLLQSVAVKAPLPQAHFSLAYIKEHCISEQLRGLINGLKASHFSRENLL